MEYKVNHTINDNTINIQVIHNKNYYPNLNQKIKDFLVYETNISNNDTNQNILKDNNFTYHHVGNKLIICNNDTTFQLDKMECNYYDFMEMKKCLEDTTKDYTKTNKELKKCLEDTTKDYTKTNKELENKCKTLEKTNNEMCQIIQKFDSKLDKMYINLNRFAYGVYIRQQIKLVSTQSHGRQNPHTFMDNLCGNPAIIDMLIRTKIYVDTPHGICKNPHPKAYKIIKEQYSDNKYNSYLSYNRNPDVIQLLYNKFTLFTTDELYKLFGGWDVINPLIVTIIERIAQNQPNADMGMSSNPKGHDIVKKVDNYRRAEHAKSTYDRKGEYIPIQSYYTTTDIYEKVGYGLASPEWYQILKKDIPDWLNIWYQKLPITYDICKVVDKSILKVLVDKHYNKLDWSALSANPIELLEKNLLKIDWIELAGNHNAGKLLEEYEEFLL
jgi:hypothetical protein